MPRLPSSGTRSFRTLRDIERRARLTKVSLGFLSVGRPSLAALASGIRSGAAEPGAVAAIRRQQGEYRLSGHDGRTYFGAIAWYGGLRGLQERILERLKEDGLATTT